MLSLLCFCFFIAFLLSLVQMNNPCISTLEARLQSSNKEPMFGLVSPPPHRSNQVVHQLKKTHWNYLTTTLVTLNFEVVGTVDFHVFILFVKESNNVLKKISYSNKNIKQYITLDLKK